MRTLVITPMLPVQSQADIGGKHRRMAAFLRAFHGLSQRIDLVQIVPESLMGLAHDAEGLNRSQSDFWGVPVEVTLLARRQRGETFWNHYGASIFSAQAQKALYPYGGAGLAEQIGAHLDAAPDLVFVDRIDAMLPVLNSGRKPKAMFLDFDDVYHNVLLRACFSGRPTAAGLLSALQAPALMLAERRGIAASTFAFACSPADRRHLRQLGVGDKVRTIANALPVPEVPPGVVAQPTVLYLGSFHHLPNVLAAERLVRSIWPAVRAAVPGARLLVAGAGSEDLPSRVLAAAGVEYLGFVDDLPALYAASRLVCCPITTGSGTRLKLVEAASYARPMVSTRLGAEGLDFRDDVEILLRDDDAGLAQACVKLLLDDARCHTLGDAGRAAMRRHYDVALIEQHIGQVIAEALGG